MRPEIERRLELVGLERDVLDRYPIELSGGMKQRMVMVISTLLNPSLLIADEITSALDVSTQKAVAETLVEFRDRELVRSMIVITHDMSILSQIADTITVMYAGKLAEKAADRRRSSTRPRHPYTRLLISSLPEVGVRYADKRLTGIPGSPPALLDPPVGCRFRARCPLADAQVSRGAAVRRDRAATTSSPAGRSPDAVLTLDHVSKIYKVGTFGGTDLPAVRDVSFDVDAGQVVSLIGESGSGKTTIGRMILRLTRDHARHDHLRRPGRRPQDCRARLLPAGPGRLPGPVQLVQPDLQGRPRLRHDPRRLLPRHAATRSGRPRRGVARGAWASTRARCCTSTRTS